ncbi:hypothetical protein Tsubulata_017213 [Turnera subulata]|uniref:Uncharacterized protein n=1 Tax=Turnera subulata TaxID=218843 RepID=A0A9Q0FNZ8_9ROSI|nr:hypothetical protein Tsubulata_017213 [Turnera subulata]
MGNCVPIQRNPDPAMKVKCNINSQAGSAQVESVPFKDNKVNTDHHLIAELSSKPQSLPMPYEASFRDLSNLEEVYFDSQPWLDSDVEDFISVYGDSTPSCNTTPVHQASLVGTPPSEPFDASSGANLIAEPSPTDMKKQLIELFREGFHSNSDDDQQQLQDSAQAKHSTACTPPKFSYGGRYESIASSGTNRHGYRKKKAAYSPQCCLPNIVRSLSSTERRKQRSPANARGQ